jgi:uncharacterized protein with FMN-binding domain
MRRIVVWLASTVTIVVLLFGYHTSTNKATTGAVPMSTETRSSPSSPASGESTTSGGTTPDTTSGVATTKTYTGDVVQTRWGPVQVQITVRSDKITKVTVLQQPDGNRRDVEINDYALPILIHDTISAQSANIDMVSGATVTSDGYLRSLQAALDQAGI